MPVAVIELLLQYLLPEAVKLIPVVTSAVESHAGAPAGSLAAGSLTDSQTQAAVAAVHAKYPTIAALTAAPPLATPAP
jgi:hypothetical protein